MTLYLDTSVLLKLLVTEPGSVVAAQLTDSADVVAAARLGYAEARAALAAASRNRRITPAQLRRLKTELELLWSQFVIVEMTEELVRLAGDLAEAERLRGYDAVHLAAALTVGADIVATADLELLKAARHQGMHVANPA